MAIITSGQITMVDLSDAPVLSAFITAGQAATQTYDATAQTWSPNYGSTPQTLTLNLTKAGSTTSIIGGISGTVKWARIDGTTRTAISSTTNTDTQYMSGSKREVLTTKVNVPIAGSASRFEASGTWVDGSTGLSVDFSAMIDLTVVQLAKSPLVLRVYGAGGTVFVNSLPETLTVNADLYKGNTISGGNKQFKFFVQDSSVNSTSAPGYDALAGLGWALCTASTTGQTPNVAPGTNTTGQGVLTVSATAVTNAQTYMVICTDQAGGTAGSVTKDVITLVDYSDPIVMVIESTGGDVFKNGSGSTVLNAKLIRKGEEIDAAGTTYTYKWSKRDKNGVLVANFGGTGNQYKTGKTLSVSASEVSAKSTYVCEVNEK